MDEHERLNELIPVYALGSLERAEALELALHLEQCEICQEELAGYDETVAELALAVPDVAPPAGMKERLFDRIDTRPGPPPVARPVPARTSLWRRAAVALLLFLVASNLLLWQRLSEVENVAPAHFETLVLNPTDYMPRARGIMIIGGNDHFGTLVVQYLPDLEEGQEYQLWLQGDEGWLDGGAFPIDDGYHSHWLETAQPLGSFPLYQITIEPEGGSETPTGPAVLMLEQ